LGDLSFFLDGPAAPQPHFMTNSIVRFVSVGICYANPVHILVGRRCIYKNPGRRWTNTIKNA
jgi:hypothetical protein